VSGWDDPRILTLNGLRRRGYTPEAINMFCDIVSVTRRGNENIINDYILEMCLRRDLDKKAKRTMAVVDPVKLTLTNVKEDYLREVEVLDFPKDPNSAKHIVTLRKHNFVERSDVLVNDTKGFFGIAPGKLVRLKYSHVIKVNNVTANEKGEVTLVEAEVIEDSKDKPKGVLHWISENDAVPAEARLYDRLFTEENPNELEDYIKALNPNSLKIIPGARINRYLLSNSLQSEFK
jgi:glutaminyl-tRNA synthetase